jgi:hypothetical protein
VLDRPGCQPTCGGTSCFGVKQNLLALRLFVCVLSVADVCGRKVSDLCQLCGDFTFGSAAVAFRLTWPKGQQSQPPWASWLHGYCFSACFVSRSKPAM